MRVILDANVLIAAVATRGLCEAVMELCLAQHDLLVSAELIAEVHERLLTKIKAPPARVAEFCDLLRQHGVVLAPAPVPRDACRDRKDLYLLGLAAASHAELLVTGDKDLLVLRNFEQTRIVTPRQFWEEARAT